MCGILFSKGISENTFKRSLSRQTHRGPDNTDFIANKDIIIGHNRLSIQDLGKNSNQPMCLDNFIIAYNGEIYNTDELRGILKKLDVEFKTNGDTEILLKGLIHFGTSFLENIRGMFAFVLYDKVENTCLIGRDYYGQKPIFQACYNKKLLIGSELNTVNILDDSKLDLESINYYLHYGFFPDYRTPKENISEFPRNFYRKIDLDTLKTIEEGNIIKNETKTIESPILNVEKACNERLLSDVPLGIFLSSGIDSNAIATLLRKTDVRTYTVKFDQKDESNVAFKAAIHNGLQNKILECHLDESKRFLLNIEKYQDGPFGDPSFIPMLLMCSEASKTIKVAITGDGGDELLTGYSRYKFISLAYILAIFPCFVRSLIAMFVKNRRYQKVIKGKNFNDMISVIMSGESTHFLKTKTPSYYHRTIKNPVDYVYAEENVYLKNDILVKADRASMKFGLEIRSPFMDYNLRFLKPKSTFEFFIQSLNKKSFLRKYLYKKGLGFIAKNKKMGFTYDMTSDLRFLKNEIIPALLKLPKILPELINIEEYEIFIDDFFIKKHNDYRTIFKLYSLSKWLNK